MDQLLTLPEVAKQLSVAERTVYQWAQQGKIPAFKIGSSWRFNQSDIDSWIEERRTGSSSNAAISQSRKFKFQKNKEDDQRFQGLVAACKGFIEHTVQTSDHSAFLLQQFYEDFDSQVVDEAIKQILKTKKFQIQRVKGIQGSEVDALVRRV